MAEYWREWHYDMGGRMAREMYVLKGRYGHRPPITYGELGRELGISGGRVRTIEEYALGQMADTVRRTKRYHQKEMLLFILFAPNGAIEEVGRRADRPELVKEVDTLRQYLLSIGIPPLSYWVERGVPIALSWEEQRQQWDEHWKQRGAARAARHQTLLSDKSVVDGLLPYFPRRLANALFLAGVTSLDDLRNDDDREWRWARGVGKKGMALVRSALSGTEDHPQNDHQD